MLVAPAAAEVSGRACLPLPAASPAGRFRQISVRWALGKPPSFPGGYCAPNGSVPSAAQPGESRITGLDAASWRLFWVPF